MSSLIVKALKGTVTVASAALFIQIGSAAAASPRADFQQQVRRVLAGTPARPSIARRVPGRPARLERNTDAQAFMRGLLLGESASRPGAAESARRQQPTGALEIARGAGPSEDAQTSVRQLLLGQQTPMRGAL